MGLPRRPEVLVRTPSAIFVGERAVLEVVIEADRETKVDFIDVQIKGVQKWAIGGGESAYGTDVTFPTLEKRVMGQGVLAPGSHSFSVAFTLPAGTAPSHELSPAVARTFVDVHASIPWWPDGRYRFLLPVRLRPPRTAQRTPVSLRASKQEETNEPRIEIGLASSTLVAGEVMLGSCAVFHLSDSAARDVTVSFEPYLSLRSSGRQYTRWGDGYRTTISLPPGSAGTAVPIRISLPEAITPSFTALTHDLQWYLKLKVGSLFTKRVEALVPLEILDQSATDNLPKLTLVPRVADQRVLEVFRRFAQQRGLTVVPEVPAVVRALDVGEIRIAYAYRGKAGTVLIGSISYAPLGLALAVRPSTAVRELFVGDLTADVDAWDREHRVDAREAVQAVPFLRDVVPTLRAGALVRWTDDEIVFETSITSVELDRLAALLATLEQIANKIASTRAAIPPPAQLDVDLAAWQALAERMSGRLCTGDMSFEGKLDTTPVRIGLVFDQRGRALAMRAHVGEPYTATERLKEASLALASPARQIADVSHERARAVIARWTPNISDLEVHDGIAAASLPVAEGGTDAARVRELIRSLQELRAAFDESMGPYR